MSSNARRSRARNRRRSSRINKIVLVIVSLILGMILSTAAAMGSVALVALSWLEDLPDYTNPASFDTSQPTRVYSADGVLLARFFLENREPISIDDMSPYILEAIVAVEDERFFEHEGVDMQGIARATVMTALGSREGGSTITQQYVRQTVLRDEATDMSLRRKLREAYLAIEVENHFSKEEILEMYLNTVFFGAGAHGIQIASYTYFGIPASDLNLAQAAALAGIPQRPNALNPYNNPELTLQRRAHVLHRMYENEKITYEQRHEAEEAPLDLDRIDSPEHGIYDAGYFVTHIRRELQNNFSEADVFGGGLEVHTTLDTRMQRVAETAVWDMIGSDPSNPEGALVSIEVDTGHVIAMVGGRDFAADNFNLATQARRQPGSTFKTFGMIAAIEKGMSPSFRLDSSSPATIGSGGNRWIVNNAEGRGRGMMSLSSTMAASINTGMARLAYEIGADSIVDVANRMGITTELQPFPSIVLGAQGVTVYEMATAGSTLAAGGTQRDPVSITEVIDRNGETIFEWEDTTSEALTPEVSWASTQVLMGTITGGTGSRARVSGWQVAGKTGTSQQNRDVWFMGYTPVLSTAVWVGHKEEKTIFLNGSRGFGGTISAPIWRDFMQVALQEYEPRRFATAAPPPFNNAQFNLPTTSSASDDDSDSNPSLAGLTLAQARAMLSGFDVSTTEAYSDTVPAGRIISASFSGSSVTITISRGPRPGGSDNNADAPAAPPPGATTPPPTTTPPPAPPPDTSTPTSPTP
ncbi:MAG: PBP1A family penicillin-binding protein [Coriobacteriia bacterium]|nr:PBP1A family penicillin-binding protein [Coriobacteriia bacterium]